MPLAALLLLGLGLAGALVPAPRPATTRRTVLSAEHFDAVVIGSGVSGSCLAHYLSSSGASVLVAEARAEVGGNVISRNENGYIWEEGPNSFQPTPTIMRTAYEAGIADELVFANPKLPPWVFWEGELKPLPKNLPGDLLNFDLLTWPGKIRAGLGAVGLLLAPSAKEEETIEEFVTRHLGRECFERIIDPFVSGVYAGDPKRLSMRAVLRKIFRLQTLSFNGALVPGALVRFQEIAQEKKDNPPDPKWPTYKAGELGSFRKGLKTLPDAIAERLTDVSTDCRLLSAAKEDAVWKLTFEHNGKERIVTTRAVGCTAPAHALSNVIESLSPETAQALASVYYPPVASVTLSYPKTAFKMPDLPGFGNLNPRSQNVRTLGTIWSSSLFPGRCPEDRNLVLNYIGGSRDPDIAQLSTEQLVAQVDADLRKTILKPSEAPPPTVVGVRLWPTAIPQYHLGHQAAVLDKIDAFERQHTGFFLGGNYRTGVAFGDCVQYGFDAANTIKSFLDASHPPAPSPDTADLLDAVVQEQQQQQQLDDADAANAAAAPVSAR